MKRLSVLLLCAVLSSHALADMRPVSEDSDNADCHHWPLVMAESWLKENKIQRLDLNKTTGKRIAFQKIKKNLFNNVFLFSFVDTAGNKYKVITRNIASDEECSISSVEIYVISQSNDYTIGNLKKYLHYVE